MRKHGLLLVEGPHDTEFIACLLKPHGLHRVQLKPDLEPFWDILVPKQFPADGEDLLKRVPVPMFIQNGSHSVAIRCAIGDTQLVRAAQESLAVLDFDELVGIGIILDADENMTPKQRFSRIRSTANSIGLPLNLPEQPGQISNGSPKSGVFVLPDNESKGTLEDILLECASESYPSLLQGAKTFVQTDVSALDDEDLRDLKKPAGKKKAMVSSIASILRPGKAIQVSLQDNRWIKDKTLDLEKVKSVSLFLSKLLELT